ncbi:transposase, partial [Synechocystis salina LEGE 06099]
KYIRPLIEKAGAHLIFLPPYSPDFSPIENCWSKIKQILKTSEPRNYSELKQAVGIALEALTLVDIHNWFVHCCYCDSPLTTPVGHKLLPHLCEKCYIQGMFCVKAFFAVAMHLVKSFTNRYAAFF